MTPKPLAREIASLLQARLNCQADQTKVDWLAEHTSRLEHIADNLLPSGSGIDNGTKIDLERSTPERIVLTFGFHHMDENGYYDGWTDHTVTIKASLVHGLDIHISGRNRHDIKDYLYDTYSYVLDRNVVWSVEKGAYTWAE